jgi:exonuclease V gamma subunit
VACASGTPTTSVQIGLNGVVQFDAVPPESANQYLRALVALYVEAWQHPLPLSRKSACAYIAALQFANSTKYDSADDLHTHAIFEARKVFEGSHHRIGELTESNSLQRVFSGFEDIEADLPMWSQRLYGAIAQHAKLVAIAPSTADETSTL